MILKSDGALFQSGFETTLIQSRFIDQLTVKFYGQLVVSHSDLKPIPLARWFCGVGLG